MLDAKLLFYTQPNGVITENEVIVYVQETDIYGQEFYNSYQAGIEVRCAYEVNKYDFELTRHLDKENNKVMYATKLNIEGAVYDIVRHQTLKNDKILLICS